MADNILNTPLTYLKGIGPEKAELLKNELGLKTFEDLLYHFPFRYVDRTSIQKIGELDENMPYIQVAGKIEKVQELGQQKAKRLVAEFRDDTGVMELIWFKKVSWIKQYIKPGMEFLAFGKPGLFKNKFSIVHPELESLKDENGPNVAKRLQPVYSTTEKLKNNGFDSRGFQKLEEQLLEKAGQELKEFFPPHVVSTYKFLSRKDAFRHIHFPVEMDLQKRAEYRLKFEELFFIQLRLLQMKVIRMRDIKGYVFDLVGNFFNGFYKNCLPFELTNAQKRVIREIRYDVNSGKQMNRLLQGDVGSGKTVVALMSMLLAIDNGMQACLMAPTEILATQHFKNISAMTFGLGVNIRLLTGSTKGSERKAIANELKENTLHILIGTHAVLEDWIQFTSLGLVIIDEQHRFGVAQRARLWGKSKIPPHILVMTATPIPRTLAMTLYGDLDVSIIDELPPGRKEIVTKHSYESQRLPIFNFLKLQISEGRQVYIVYPLIEESETLDYNNLMAGYEAISREFPKPAYQVSIVHGRMNAADKEFEMQRFKKGETQIMVSTTVIEVGVDVPNATVMVIENADRFGLSQLHQLRGRVGRGGSQSYCILITGFKLSKDAGTRLKTMVRTNNGFEIAEIDLKLRGPGDIIGTQQSGLLNLKIANLALDQAILQEAREAASDILEKDPALEASENKALSEFVREREKARQDWSIIS
jgi:ATP-dependent DNA helicase RecG